MLIRKLIRYFTVIDPPKPPAPTKVKYRINGLLYEATVLPYDDQYAVVMDGEHKGLFLHILDIIEK